jgi:hypothetical protein
MTSARKRLYQGIDLADLLQEAARAIRNLLEFRQWKPLFDFRQQRACFVSGQLSIA